MRGVIIWHYINFERSRTPRSVVIMLFVLRQTLSRLHQSYMTTTTMMGNRDGSFVSESLGVLSVEKSNACIREFCTRNLFYLHVCVYINVWIFFFYSHVRTRRRVWAIFLRLSLSLSLSPGRLLYYKLLLLLLSSLRARSFEFFFLHIILYTLQIRIMTVYHTLTSAGDGGGGSTDVVVGPINPVSD